MRKIEQQIIDNRSFDYFDTYQEMIECWGHNNLFALNELSYLELKPCLSKINHEYTQLLKVVNTYYMWYSMELDF